MAVMLAILVFATILVFRYCRSCHIAVSKPRSATIAPFPTALGRTNAQALWPPRSPCTRLHPAATQQMPTLSLSIPLLFQRASDADRKSLGCDDASCPFLLRDQSVRKNWNAEAKHEKPYLYQFFAPDRMQHTTVHHRPMNRDFWQNTHPPPDPPLIPAPCIQQYLETVLGPETTRLKPQKPRETQRGSGLILQAPASIPSQPVVQPDRRDRQPDCKVQEPLNVRGRRVVADAEQLAHFPRLVFHILVQPHDHVERPGPTTGKFNAEAPRIGRMKVEPDAPEFSFKSPTQLAAPRQPHDTMAASVLVTPEECLRELTSTDPLTPLHDSIPQSLVKRHSGRPPSRPNHQRLPGLQSLHDHPDMGPASLRVWVPMPTEPRPPRPWKIPALSSFEPLELPPLVPPFDGGLLRTKSTTAKIPAETIAAPQLPELPENPPGGTRCPLCWDGYRGVWCMHEFFQQYDHQQDECASDWPETARIPIHVQRLVPGKMETPACPRHEHGCTTGRAETETARHGGMQTETGRTGAKSSRFSMPKIPIHLRTGDPQSILVSPKAARCKAGPRSAGSKLSTSCLWQLGRKPAVGCRQD